MSLLASELRIGNWLHAKNHNANIRIREISEDMHIESYLPIELTEKWFIRMPQWVDSKRVEPAFHIHIGQDFYLNWHKSDGVYLSGVGVSDVMYLDCDHVHQLMNLYFSLTGLELEIK